MNITPYVSIGLPVYNGENFLEDAIESTLAQTYKNFELIISDNASSDQTQEICEKFAAQDARVKYIRLEENLGAARNFNIVFYEAKGELFKWVAHDDIIAPTYLEKCVEVLANDPSVVLCHTEVLAIDENAQVVGSGEDDPSVILQNVDSYNTHLRFKDLILIPHYCYDVFGVIRTAALKQTSLIASHIGSDLNLLVELSLQGRLVRLPEPLFYSRDHGARSVRAIPLRERGEWFDIDNKGRIMMPMASQYAGYLRSVRNAPLSKSEKLRCFSSLTVWLGKNKRYLLRELRDVVYVLPMQLRLISKN